MSIAGDKIDPKRKESPARSSRSPRGGYESPRTPQNQNKSATPKAMTDLIDINQDLNIPSSPKLDKARNGTIKLVNMAPYMMKTEKPDIPIGIPRYLEQRNNSFLIYRRKVSQDDGQQHVHVTDQRITQLENR